MTFVKGHKLCLGRKYSIETLKKMRNSHLGHVTKPETKQKLSLAFSGNKNPMYGKRGAMNGRKQTQGAKEKIRKSRLGKKRSAETCKKISLGRIGKYTKEKSPMWKGGKSFEIYPEEWTDTLKESIRIRDNHICVECGIHQDELDFGQIKKLDIHHIDYDKRNCNPSNLISL